MNESCSSTADWRKQLEHAARQACERADPAHDLGHVLRVRSLACRIALAEGADLVVVEAAALLHELFNYPKGHPESHRSGDVCADKARPVLNSVGFASSCADQICDCIRVHGFSLGAIPSTLEGKVLQDADRLDAIGAIGIARCFATCAAMGRPFYAPTDPFCRTRDPDDKRWGIDHFYRKLLRIPERLHTPTAGAIARDRIEFLHAFLEQLEREVG